MKKIELGQTLTILANMGVPAGSTLIAIQIRQSDELVSPVEASRQ